MQQTSNTKLVFWVIVLCLIVIAGVLYIFKDHTAPAQTSSQTGTATSTLGSQYGLNEYTDATYGFSFWYPNTLQITKTATQDSASFPGGIATETLQIGSMGGTSVVVVNSPTGTITDEANGHASPIGQTKYFYDSTSGQWMVAYPDSAMEGAVMATTTANVSTRNPSGLLLLPSGRRFDTTIIPLTTTLFLVISDGGGSSFTSQLAQTVGQMGVSVDPSMEGTALQAEENAYTPTETYYKGALTCTDSTDCPTGDSCLQSGPLTAGQQNPKVCVPDGQAVPL
jgi:hypothetical protein